MRESESSSLLCIISEELQEYDNEYKTAINNQKQSRLVLYAEMEITKNERQ